MATSRKRALRRNNKSPVIEEARIRGFARLQIGETQRDGSKRIVGDSGWFKNTFTADGKLNYIAGKVGSATGSKTPSHLVVATQSTAVDSTQSVLVGEHTIRIALTPSTTGTGTLQMTGSYASSQNDAAKTIGSVAVHNTSTNAASTMGSGQTFTTSQWAKVV